MNKKELYRSIEGIRQDRHLKERIIRAAQEKKLMNQASKIFRRLNLIF